MSLPIIQPIIYSFSDTLSPSLTLAPPSSTSTLTLSSTPLSSHALLLSPIPNIIGVSLNGVHVSPFSLGQSQYVLHGVTPLSSDTIISSSPPLLPSLPLVTPLTIKTSQLIQKSKNLPQYLSDAFDKRIIHSTRNNPIPQGMEKWK